jgi:hypothetical protein
MLQPPLLITSAVTPSDLSVALSDKDRRIEYTLDAIGQWLKICPAMKVVLCDGSNFDFRPLLDQKFPGNTIESLRFLNSGDKVRALGKGYGEGEIVQYALAHSQYLAQADYFAKCTSKLWVNNYKACLRCWNGSMLFQAKVSNVLKNKPLIFRHIDTRFYLIKKSIYEERFLTVHLEVNDAEDHSLEHCFMDAINQAAYAHFNFPIPPMIEGYSGSTGDYFLNTRWGYFAEYMKLRVLQRRTNAVSPLNP